MSSSQTKVDVAAYENDAPEADVEYDGDFDGDAEALLKAAGAAEAAPGVAAPAVLAKNEFAVSSVDDADVEMVLKSFIALDKVEDVLTSKTADEKLSACYQFLCMHCARIASSGSSSARADTNQALRLMHAVLKVSAKLGANITSFMLVRDNPITNMHQVALIISQLAGKVQLYDWSTAIGLGTASGAEWSVPGYKLDLTYFPFFCTVVKLDTKAKFNYNEKALNYWANLKAQSGKNSLSAFFASVAYWCKYFDAPADLPDGISILDVPPTLSNFAQGLKSENDRTRRYIRACLAFGEAQCIPKACVVVGAKKIVALFSTVIEAYLLKYQDAKDCLMASREIRKKTVHDTLLKEIYTGVPVTYQIDRDSRPIKMASVVEKGVPAFQFHARCLADVKGLAPKEAKFALIYVGVTTTGPNYQVSYAQSWAAAHQVEFAPGDNMYQLSESGYIDVSSQPTFDTFIKRNGLAGHYLFWHLDVSNGESAELESSFISQAVTNICRIKKSMAMTIKASAFKSYSLYGQAEVLLNVDGGKSYTWNGARAHNGEIYIGSAFYRNKLRAEIRALYLELPEWSTKCIKANATRGICANECLGASSSLDVSVYSMASANKKKDKVLAGDTPAIPITSVTPEQLPAFQDGDVLIEDQASSCCVLLCNSVVPPMLYHTGIAASQQALIKDLVEMGFRYTGQGAKQWVSTKYAAGMYTATIQSLMDDSVKNAFD